MNDYQLSTNNYQLPAGYQQTEVGVIPEDWEVKELVSLITAGPKNGYSGRAGGDAKGTSTLRLTATSSGYLIINDETVKQLDEIIDPSSELFLKPGDVLIQRSNTYELVGTTAIFDGLPKTYVYPDLMMRLRFSDQLTAHWFWKYANSTNGRRFFLSAAAGSTGSMPKISGAKLRKMLIPLPHEDERRSIAQALSDVDALIAALDKAIAKKRHLKTATMQQLLTGKKRLPGFGAGKGYKESAIGVIPEDWQVCNLKELCSAIVDGTHYTPSYVSDGVPFYSVENVTADDFENTKFISNEEHSRLIRRCKPEKGDLLLTRIGSLGATKLLDWDVDASIYVSLALLKLNERAYPTYVYAYSKSKQFFKDVEKRSLTNATPQKINMGDVGNIPIPTPLDQGEQRAIATVLSDMDAEIAALETRLAKTQALKQGMMQQLLTGRVRLV